MGKITLVVEGTTVGTLAEGRGVSIPYEVSETDSARLIAAMADFHASNFVRDDGAGNMVAYKPTIEDIIREWFNGVAKTAMRQTIDYEKRKAAVAQINVAGL